MTEQELDDYFHEHIFTHGTIEELEEFKAALLNVGDLIFASAVQSRIDEKIITHQMMIYGQDFKA